MSSNHSVSLEDKINKRKRVVDVLRRRYNNLVPASELEAILPDPTEAAISKRIWEAKMFQARTKLMSYVEEDEPCIFI